jgi:hypothetical protein
MNALQMCTTQGRHHASTEDSLGKTKPAYGFILPTNT